MLWRALVELLQELFGPMFWGVFTKYYLVWNWEFVFWEFHKTFSILSFVSPIVITSLNLP
jgi:hypothetical protein